MDADLYEKLLAAAFRFVSFRLRSQAEIQDYLAKISKSDSTVKNEALEAVTTRLKELGYIDDEKFSRWWIESRLSTKPKGFRVIQEELNRKGIDRQIITSIINEYRSNSALSQDIELTAAKKSISHKLNIWAKYPVLEQKKKIYGYLIRRGFSSSTVSSIIDEIGQKDYNDEE